MAPRPPRRGRDAAPGAEVRASPASPAPGRGRPRPSAWEKSLAAVFGFGQGCCINVYLSAAGYYGARFQDDRFFVWMCACIYLPPLLVFPAARRWDAYFDRRFGAHTVFPVRLAGVLLAAAALVACLGLLRGAGGLQRTLVLGLGAGVGLLTGALANSSSQFFGTLSPMLTGWFYLGQTASGAYVNVAAGIFRFAPGCSDAAVSSYFGGAVSIAVVPCALYHWSQRAGILDAAYEHHGELIEQRSCGAGASAGGSPEPSRAFALAIRACQWAAVAQNMSLTPLADRLAHADYGLGQQIVLSKLLSDFLGRSAFYAVPHPRRLRLHLALNVLLQLCRVPAWGLLVQEALRPEPRLSRAAFFLVWVPFVSAGALGGSWSTVVALEAVPATQKSDTAGAMSLAVYLGFMGGLAFAAAVSCLL